MAEPQDPRLTEQAVRKGELEISKLEREARAAEIAGATPKLPSEVGGGALTTPGTASPLGILAAHRSLADIAAEIAEALPTEATTVWIARDDVVTRRRALHGVVTSTLRRITDDICAAQALLDSSGTLPSGGTTPTGRPTPTDLGMPKAETKDFGAAVALNLAASAIPLIGSLMKTNTTIRTADATIGFPAVAAAVARVLLESDTTVLWDGAPIPQSDELLATVAQVQRSRDVLARDLATYRIRHVDNPTPDVAVAAERLESLRTWLGEAVKKDHSLEDFDAALTAIDAAARSAAAARAGYAAAASRANAVALVLDGVDAALQALLTPDDAGVTAAQAAAAWEQNKGAYVVILTPAYGGAESTYEDVQLRRDRGLHVGSAVVSYTVVDPAGAVVAAGNAQAQAAATTTVGTTRVAWSGPAMTRAAAGAAAAAASAAEPGAAEEPVEGEESEEAPDHRGWVV